MFKVFVFLLVLLSLASCRPNLPTDEAADIIYDRNYLTNVNNLTNVTNAIGARVFWWNVAWGKYNSTHTIDHNLQKLISSSSRPDILVLGEFKSMILNSKTWELLNYHYPHQDFVPYDSKADVGIQTFSTVPFNTVAKRDLDWSPSTFSQEDQSSYRQQWSEFAGNETKYWKRRYVLYSATISGQKYLFAPMHFLEPWKAIYTNFGADTTFIKLFFGGDNPLTNQIFRYKDFLKQDLRGSNAGVPLLIIGDFNTPSSILGITPAAYTTMKLGYSSITSGSIPTFPSKFAMTIDGGSELPTRLKIDHAFVNSKLVGVAGATLEMVGSDHYPIYVVLKPRSSSIFPW